MGAMISSFVDNLQNDAQKQKLADDALNMMMELGKQQVEAFKLKITNGNVDTKHIPIGQILFDDWQVRCAISNKPDDIGAIIKNSYSAFAKGDIAEGISQVVSSGMNVVLGSYEGNKSDREIYSITTGDLGGIQRIDIKLFAYRYASKQLTDIVKDCIAVAIVISSVDPKNITEDSIRVLVQNQFGALGKAKEDALLKTLLDARKAALGMPNP